MDRSRSRLLLIDLGFSAILLETLRSLLEIAEISLAQSPITNANNLTALIPQIINAIEDLNPAALLICCKPVSLPLVIELLAAATATVHLPIVLAVAESPGPEKLNGILEAGAAEYLLPPFDADHVLPRLQRVLPRQLIPESDASGWKRRVGLESLVGESPAFIKALVILHEIAHSQETVLIRGETGTGKELCARALHQLSCRANQPFVAVNCGCIPAELFESELFGHAAGAFTGANKSFAGFIARAQGGTLLLDEINSLASALQAKFLRFLDEKEYHPLGSEKSRQADLRILAATNGDLTTAVRAGTFRADLYHRLACLEIALPPLRERASDVLLLAEHFLSKSAADAGNQ